MATQSEVEAHLIQAWACFKKDKPADASWFAQEAATSLHVAGDEGWTPDCPPVPRLRFKDWFIMNPGRWFSTNVTPDHKEKVTKRKKVMKKLIGLILISSAAGVGSNYLSSPFDGPTQLNRGEFAAVQQCESCQSIRSDGVDICVDCGSTKAIERIAAPLTHLGFPFTWMTHDGWQFKDGSTKFEEVGEYIVPELVVLKTMRM